MAITYTTLTSKGRARVKKPSLQSMLLSIK